MSLCISLCRYEAELRRLLDDLKSQRDREKERVRELMVARRNKHSSLPSSLSSPLSSPSAAEAQREEAKMMREIDEDHVQQASTRYQ